MTNSIAFPNLFDVARNRVGVLDGNASIVNRSKLLIMTEPGELYNCPDFGVGLKQHLWKYNNENTKALIKERIKDQLRKHEPSCDADRTQFTDGLLYSGDESISGNIYNQLKLTVAIATVYGDIMEVGFTNEQ